MNSLTLSFNNVTFNPVAQNDGQIWLTSSQIAEALEYKNTQSITKLFNTNSDEFDETMVKIVKLPTVNHAVTDSVTTLKTKGLSNKMRIFSLRGCHLLAMFARTAKAKEFRKWVLNILAKEVGQPVLTKIETDEKITDKQAYQLKTAVEKRCKNNKEHYQTVWTALKHRFEVPKYTDILIKDFDNAMNLVWTVALPQTAVVVEQNTMVNIRELSRLGKNKVEANKVNFEIIEKALTMIDYAVGELRKNNATHHSVFENIFCQSV